MVSPFERDPEIVPVNPKEIPPIHFTYHDVLLTGMNKGGMFSRIREMAERRHEMEKSLSPLGREYIRDRLILMLAGKETDILPLSDVLTANGPCAELLTTLELKRRIEKAEELIIHNKPEVQTEEDRVTRMFAGTILQTTHRVLDQRDQDYTSQTPVNFIATAHVAVNAMEKIITPRIEDADQLLKMRESMQAGVELVKDAFVLASLELGESQV